MVFGKKKKKGNYQQDDEDIEDDDEQEDEEVEPPRNKKKSEPEQVQLTKDEVCDLIEGNLIRIQHIVNQLLRNIR